jgi:hypothetical protein
MKLKQLTIYLFLIALATNAIAQKDSITIGKKKQFFIGVNAGLGLGWRINDNIPDSAVGLWVNSGGEGPDLAYGFGVNYGYFNKIICLSIGIEYITVKYSNRSNTYQTIRPYYPYDTSIFVFNYQYSHELISIPINFSFLLGKKKSLQMGVSFTPSWLVDYELNKYDLDKSYPVLMVGVFFGRKILEISKMDLSIIGQFNYSSLIGYKEYVNGKNRTYLQSMPHHLIVPSIGINLNYKL